MSDPGYLSRLWASVRRFLRASDFTMSESKSYNNPDSNVTAIPSPTRSTLAPGMFCASSFAWRSMREPIRAPAAPPTAAPMIAPRAVWPLLLPINPPTMAPVPAPTAAPVWVCVAQLLRLKDINATTVVATEAICCRVPIVPPCVGGQTTANPDDRGSSSPPNRPIQRRVRRCRIGTTLRQPVLRLELGPLRIEHREQVRRAFAVSQPSEVRRPLARGTRFLQPLHLHARGTIAAETRLHVRHGGEHRLAVLRARGPLPRRRRVDLRLHPPEVEPRPSDDGPDHVAQRRPVAHGVELWGQVSRTAPDRDLRQIARLGRADERALCGGQPLRHRHVGPVAHDRLGIRDRRDVRQRRERRREVQLLGDRTGRAPHERTDAVLRRRHLRFARWNRRQRGAELRLRPLGIERAAAPRFETPLGQLERLLLIVGVLPRHGELLLRSPQLEVGARQIGGER